MTFDAGPEREAVKDRVRKMIADGTLQPGALVPSAERLAKETGAALRVKLSATLRARRKATGMTQQDLAGKLGVSVTTVGHAETAGVWHSWGFWRRAGEVLGDGGDMLRLYDQLKHPVPEPPPPVLPLSVVITADGVLVTWPDGTENLMAPPVGLRGAGAPLEVRPN